MMTPPKSRSNAAFPDRLIVAFDRSLRTLLGVVTARRPLPVSTGPAQVLTDKEAHHSGALMRVNQVGEVCAQGLYRGQALASREPSAVEHLERAAQEEEDHLAWTNARLEELGARPSLLNPVWYAGSFALGVVAGLSGTQRGLGFVVETERQVERHLSGHLDTLPEADRRSRVIVEMMRQDEAEHGRQARHLGGVDLPLPVRLAMRAAAAVMTKTAYRI